MIDNVCMFPIKLKHPDSFHILNFVYETKGKTEVSYKTISSFRMCFITEGIDNGYFGLWPDTKILVLKGALYDDEFSLLQQRVREFEVDRTEFRYNLMGLVTSYIGIPWHRRKHYTCSGFVAYLFRDILDFGKDYSLVQQEDFYKFDFEKIYEGTAGEYDYEKLSI